MRKIYMAIMIAALAVAGCSTAKVKTTGKTISLTKAKKAGDYFDENTVLAAMSMLGGGYSEVSFYPARMLEEASEATKSEAKVQSLLGSSDVAEGEIAWTPLVVYRSHPAKQEDIKKGMIVMAVVDENPRTPEDLKNHSTWHRVIVLDTDELYKGNVKTKFFWTPGEVDESDRIVEVPLTNIRVIDSANFKTSM